MHPQHLAIIMDGNRRWAAIHNKETTLGHKAGANALINLCKHFKEFNIPYLTVYAFSSENNNRTTKEKAQLFLMLEEYIDTNIPKLRQEGVCVRFIGEFSIFSKVIQNKIQDINTQSESGYNYHLTIALNYGGRQEIVHACKMQNLQPDITIQSISEKLYTNLPDVDLLIRTGGMQRLSNFLIWQSIYAELYFCETLWPDFTTENLQTALDFYQKQQRNFGR